MGDTISLALFAEDEAHELMVPPLIDRVAEDLSLGVATAIRSAAGGHGRVLAEATAFLRDVSCGRVPRADLIVVCTDANCVGLAERRREVEAAVAKSNCGSSVVPAIPDPHVERWMLLDGKAFKAVVGKGCPAPDIKCERGRYKRQLKSCVREAGRQPIIGGMEYAKRLVAAMDLDAAARQDVSLGQFISSLRVALRSVGRAIGASKPTQPCRGSGELDDEGAPT